MNGYISSTPQEMLQLDFPESIDSMGFDNQKLRYLFVLGDIPCCVAVSGETQMNTIEIHLLPILLGFYGYPVDIWCFFAVLRIHLEGQL